MIRLTPDTIRLGAHAASREEAIRTAGGLLVEHGYIAPEYVESMLGRERQANTYLGSGIAIPHGQGADRDLIRRTGVSVVQLAEPVEWGDGQEVRLVVGIAARSDEHIGVLAALTDVLDDAGLAHRLARTDDPAEIVAAFARRVAPPSEPEPERPDAHVVEVRIQGEAGLHARPATRLVELATPYDAEIRLEHAGRRANAKALASLLKLGVRNGDTVRLFASGPDAAAALQALQDAIRSGLGEEEGRGPVEAPPDWAPVAEVRSTLTGVSASPGLAIGELFQFQATRIVVTDRAGADPAAEKWQLGQALETAREQLDELFDSVRARVGNHEAVIFRAHQALLADTDLLHEVDALIDGGHGAAWSWERAMAARIAAVQQLQDERLADRAADLRDVGQRVLRALVDTVHGEPHLPEEPVILVADDLTPSDAARLDPQRILGLCTASGGPTSHTAIIARSLGIPAVVGAGPRTLELAEGTPCILDGSAGRLYVEPGDANLGAAQAFQANVLQRREAEFASRFQPAIMSDGYRVEVVANIGKAAEARQAVEAGAEGVGLMRTEFLFLHRSTAPTEEEQFQAFTEMTRALDGLPLIVRTLDIGGDKVLPYLALPAEQNPFLGVRGIRLCLRKPELFLPQLRAIYRAASAGSVKIMFPMVATLEELREARQLAEQVRRELEAPAVEIGIMIEVPSAVLIADELAREVDFFSIGTNDLTQYVLAIDRLHPTLGAQVDGLHPAVLRMIERTVGAAERAGRWVGVCGGIAGEPLGALILTGLGVRELSMSLPSVPAIKAMMRRYSSAQAKTLAQRALACATAAEVRKLPLPDARLP